MHSSPSWEVNTGGSFCASIAEVQTVSVRQIDTPASGTKKRYGREMLRSSYLESIESAKTIQLVRDRVSLVILYYIGQI